MTVIYNQTLTGSDADSDYSRYHAQAFEAPNTNVTGSIASFTANLKKAGTPTTTYVGVYYPGGDITNPTYTDTVRNGSDLTTSFSEKTFTFATEPDYQNGDYIGIEFSTTAGGVVSIQSSGYISAPVTGVLPSQYWNGSAWVDEACSGGCRYYTMSMTQGSAPPSASTVTIPPPVAMVRF